MLSGENSSYAMAVCKLGYLHHIYYGDRLEESSIPCLPENSALGWYPPIERNVYHYV